MSTLFPEASNADLQHHPVKDRFTNATLSALGHNCQLPVFIEVPVSLDPRTGDRANKWLIVQCTICSTLWGVRTTRRYGMNGPDPIWRQLQVQVPLIERLLARVAVKFDATVAYKLPDPNQLSWSSNPFDSPRKLNGVSWRRTDFPELLGQGDNRCSSISPVSYSINNVRPMITDQCLLKIGHAHMHEGDRTGWS